MIYIQVYFVTALFITSEVETNINAQHLILVRQSITYA